MEPSSSFDRFISGRATLALAFVWGLSEAIFFFIVPDFLFTLIACRSFRAAMKCTFAALLGALAGGIVMYVFARNSAEDARAFVDHVPAISPQLIARVATQIDENGLMALMLGPIKGIPYKIYAVEWGAQRGNLITFLLVSIPARYVRFFLATVAARAIAKLVEPLTHRNAAIEMTILAVVWIAFYGFYFARFGW